MKIKYTRILQSIETENQLAGTPTISIHFFDTSAIIKDSETCSVQELVEKITQLNTSVYNPSGLFVHPATQQSVMLQCAGDVLSQQHQLMDLLRELARNQNMPRLVSVETIGVRSILPELRTFINVEFRAIGGQQWHWAIKPSIEVSNIDYITDYVKNTLGTSSLQYSCYGSPKHWEDIEKHISALKYKFLGANLPPISIKVPKELYLDSIQRGYKIALPAFVRI
jgi:hypothetical protein